MVVTLHCRFYFWEKKAHRGAWTACGPVRLLPKGVQRSTHLLLDQPQPSIVQFRTSWMQKNQHQIDKKSAHQIPKNRHTRNKNQHIGYKNLAFPHFCPRKLTIILCGGSGHTRRAQNSKPVVCILCCCRENTKLILGGFDKVRGSGIRAGPINLKTAVRAIIELW